MPHWFFKSHPKTKPLVAKGEMDLAITDILTSLLSVDPSERPSNIAAIRCMDWLKYDVASESEVREVLAKRI